MRIDDVNRTPQPAGSEKVSGDTRVQKKEPQTPDRAEDSAELSRLSQSANEGNDKKLESLRLQVEAGTYAVPAQDLAASILKEHLKP
jgi:anti-sigma28 factor (negative regulator of flagellin synthesis)